MLWVLAAVALPILLWLGVFRPLAGAQAQAEARLAAAQRDVGAVRAMGAEVRAAEARGLSGVAALERVRRAVAAAGLASESLGEEGNGMVVLRVAAARGPVLLRLVAGLEADGLVVQRLSVSRNDDASVNASLSLSAAAR